MHRLIVMITLSLGLFAASCGDDAELTTASPDPAPSEPDPAPTEPDPATSEPGPAPTEPAPPETPPDDLPLGAGPYPIADLRVAIRLDGPDGDATDYALSCLGDTATVTVDGENQPGASRCLALLDDGRRTRLIAGEPTAQLCAEIYGGPEVATVTGTLDGEAVDTAFHRTDGCGIADWDLLGDLLSPR